MNDVTFSARSGSDTRLPIDALFYQTRQLHEVDRTLRSFLREWRTFLATFLTIMTLGALYAMLAPRQYSAEATVMAAPRQADLSRTDAIADSNGGSASILTREPDIEGEIQIITSAASLERVVQQLNLERSVSSGAQASISDLVRDVRVLLGVEQQSTADPVSFQSLAQGLFARAGIDLGFPTSGLPDPKRLTEAAVEQLRRGLQVERVGRSTVVRIRYTAHNPQVVRNVVAALSQNYFDTRDRERTDAGARASRWLRDRAAELENEVLENTARLAALRANAVVHGLDAEQLKDQMRVLSERVVAAKAKQQEAASRLSVAEDLVRAKGPVGLLNWEGASGPNEYLAQQRAIGEMYKEAARMAAARGSFNPSTARLESEARKLEQDLTIEGKSKLAILKMSLDAASGEVSSLEIWLRGLRRDYDQLEGKSQRLRAFEQAAAASQDVYKGFVSRWKMTEQVGFNEAQGWLISPPNLPTRPSKPSIPLVLLGSLLAAVCAGCSHVLYQEHRRGRTVRSSEDVERHCPGFKCTGFLPIPSGRHRRTRDVVEAAQSDPEFKEAAATLYVSLKAAMERECSATRGRVVVVSSALPLEGKSSTIRIIATAASVAGQRVIVVDCDLRVPTMHSALSVGLTPGLAECVELGMSPREVIRQDQQSGIWVMPAGRFRTNPQNVLQSSCLTGVFKALREEFDLILVDTPPILGLADTRMVGRHADYALLVVSWSRTTGQAASLALRTLAESGVTAPVGVVLTRVNVNKLATFQVPEAEQYRSHNRNHYRHYYYQPAGRHVRQTKLEGPRT